MFAICGVSQLNFLDGLHALFSTSEHGDLFDTTIADSDDWVVFGSRKERRTFILPFQLPAVFP